MTVAHSDVPILAKAGVKLAKKERNLELARKLYNSKGKKIIEEVIKIALDEKHPKQMEALKLCIDRVAPVSFFEKTGGVQRPLVQVVVTQAQGVEIKDVTPTYESEDGQVGGINP